MQILNKSQRLIVVGDVLLIPTTITTVDDAEYKKYPDLAAMIKEGTELSEVDDLVGATVADTTKK